MAVHSVNSESVVKVVYFVCSKRLLIYLHWVTWNVMREREKLSVFTFSTCFFISSYLSKSRSKSPFKHGGLPKTVHDPIYAFLSPKDPQDKKKKTKKGLYASTILTLVIFFYIKNQNIPEEL